MRNRWIFGVVCLALSSFHQTYAEDTTDRASKRNNEAVLESFSPGQGRASQGWRGVGRISAPWLLKMRGSSKGRGGKKEKPSMAVDGEELTFEFDELVTPKYGGVVHWLGHVEGKPGSRVRFTLPSSAIFSNNPDDLQAEAGVSGTISVGNKTYRVRPAGRNLQVIYEVADDSPSLSRMEVGGDDVRAERKARRLEAQGLRFDKLKGIDPETYSIGRRGVLTRIDMEEAKWLDNMTFRSERDFDTLMEELGPMLPLVGDERFVFENKGYSAEHVYYDFIQYIGDIPVVNARIRVFVSNDSDRALRVHSKIYQDMGLASTPRVNQGVAIDTALAHLKKQRGFESFEPVTVDAMRMYIQSHSERGDPLKLAWSIWMSDGQFNRQVVVDGETGEVLPSVTVHYGQVKVCDRNDHPNYFNFSCLFKQPVYDSASQCADPSRCNLPKFKVPRDVALENHTIWEENIGPNCCGDVGINGVIDIVVDSDINADFSPTPSPNPVTVEAIYANGSYSVGPGSSRPYRTIGITPAGAGDTELVAHEMGHAILHAVNPDVHNMSRPTLESVDRITRAVKEGIADINALIHKNAQKTPPYSNPSWVVLTRNMSVRKTFPTNVVIPANDYETGRILGYAFYRLVSNSNGVDFKAAGRIFHRSLEEITDDDNNSGISFEEVRRAMVKAASTAAEKAAVNEAFQDAGIVFTPSNGGSSSPSGPPSGGSGTVSAPGFVNGSVTTACSTNAVSFHTNVWGSSTGASVYDVYYSLDSFTYQYGFSEFATSAPTYNTVDVWVKVSSCNGSGCSVLSSDNYFQEYFCN